MKNLKFWKFPAGGSRSQGFRKYLTLRPTGESGDCVQCTVEPSPGYILGFGRGGLLEKGSSQKCPFSRVAPVRFGYGLGMERFERFRLSAPAVPLRRGLLSAQRNREDGSGFGSWKTVPAVPVPRSVPGKTVPTVPVSGSGSVPGPP